MSREEIYLVLRPDAGPYNAIRHLFPGSRIPITAPFPRVSAGEEETPCFQIDSLRLSPPQFDAIAEMLAQKYPGMDGNKIIEEINFGLPISQEWRLAIEGDELFASHSEAEQWAFEFSQLSNVPSIDIQISPLAAWCLVAQIQLASRHPKNGGFTAREARQVADAITLILPLSDVGRRFLDKGWNPDLDIEVTQPT